MHRGDPERIYQAQRRGIFRRLVDEQRVSELGAEHLIARRERDAEALGRRPYNRYWSDGSVWIASQPRRQADVLRRVWFGG
jgi:hypothetical protein